MPAKLSTMEGDQAAPYRDVEAGPPPYLTKPNYKLKTKW